jgi:hypothetical protein
MYTDKEGEKERLKKLIKRDTKRGVLYFGLTVASL